MRINNWFDLALNTSFILSVLGIGLPMSIYLLRKGLSGFKEHGIKKLPKNYLFGPGLGRYAVEVFFYGVFLLSVSLWCLFFDKGGQLINLITEIRRFLFS